MDYRKTYTRRYFSGKDSFFYSFGYGRFLRFYFYNLFKPLKPYLREIKSGRVLDAGCAYGFMLKKFPETFERFGIDVSGYAIKEARARLPEAILKRADIEKDLPFPEEFFEIVICNDAMEHLKNPEIALKNIKKVLKKEGVLYITTPNLNSFREKFFKLADKKEHHVSLFSHQAFLRLLIKSGFKIIDSWTYTSLTYFFFLKTKSKLGIESAFICKKLSD